MPLISEAVKNMYSQLNLSLERGDKVVKLIHGYGSSGKGGRIRTAVRRELAELKSDGEIEDFVIGEEFTPFSEKGRKLLTKHYFVSKDRDYNRYNNGITIVVL